MGDCLFGRGAWCMNKGLPAWSSLELNKYWEAYMRGKGVVE